MATKHRVIRGEQWAQALLAQLLDADRDTGAWMDAHTHLLKRDRYSQVGLLRLQDRPCCLKLYRSKSPWQYLQFALGRGRAVNSFDRGHSLRAAGIAVPEELALLRVPGGMLLLCCAIEQADNLQVLWPRVDSRATREQIMDRAAQLLARLHNAGFAHGDCKWSNWLWAQGQLYLVDLDAVCQAAAGDRRQARDLARFTLNAEELSLQPALYDLFLEGYLSVTGLSRDVLMPPMLVELQGLRQRHLQRYGESGQRLV